MLSGWLFGVELPLSPPVGLPNKDGADGAGGAADVVAGLNRLGVDVPELEAGAKERVGFVVLPAEDETPPEAAASDCSFCCVEPVAEAGDGNRLVLLALLLLLLLKSDGEALPDAEPNKDVDGAWLWPSAGLFCAPNRPPP